MKEKILYILTILSISLPLSALTHNSITIIGIGKLGLCVALHFEKAGYNVLGVDINPSYVASLNDKTFTSLEPQVTQLLQNSTRFRATCSLDEGLEFSDVYYIMVDTPTTQSKEAYDHKNVNKVLSEINKRKVTHKHIIIGSTIFPGYVRNTGIPLIKDCTHTSLSYNPEFIAQGCVMCGLDYPDIVLIGEGSKEAGDIIEQFYHTCCLNKPRICRMSPESAEITKLAVNCFITTKISYANMIGDIAEKTPGANKFNILAAVGGDKRIGNSCLKPGYGFGGPCFPRDNRALGYYAEKMGVIPHIPEATDNANKFHTQFMIKQLLEEGKETYTFEKVGYKEDCAVPLIEESQKLVIAAALAKAGKKIVIIDTEPLIQEVRKVFGDDFKYQILPS